MISSRFIETPTDTSNVNTALSNFNSKSTNKTIADSAISDRMRSAQTVTEQSKITSVMTGNEIIILFDDDINKTYRPADAKFESWKTTRFPYSNDSSREFMSGTPTGFTVRVRFITDEASASVSAKDLSAYRDSLKQNGKNLLHLTVYEYGNDTPLGILDPDRFNIYSTYIDFHFSLNAINQHYAFSIESAVPSFSTVKAVTNDLINNANKALKESSENLLGKSGQNTATVLQLLT